jgi:hypothetical protein
MVGEAENQSNPSLFIFGFPSTSNVAAVCAF